MVDYCKPNMTIEGKGTMIYSDGNEYQGDWLNGQKSGKILQHFLIVQR